MAGSVVADHVAKWNGSAWGRLARGTGITHSVMAFALSGANLYAAGSGVRGSESNSKISKWNGSSWSNLGKGISGDVHALAMVGNDLYAGGSFFNAGGEPGASFIARWDGAKWNKVGSGVSLSGDVRALAVIGADLYVGGGFTYASGESAKYIIKWDGRTWTSLGAGMNDAVEALTVSGGNLYAGGHFTTAGGVIANRVAKWDGSHWSALGAGINASIRALVVSGDDVYAGGQFSEAGGIKARRIAKWDGIDWSPLGEGFNDTVHALALVGNRLYAGGMFAGGLAKWNGVTWSSVGSSLNSSARVMLVHGTDLYVGGYFTQAGGKGTSYAARARLRPSPSMTVSGQAVAIVSGATSSSSTNGTDFGNIHVNVSARVHAFEIKNLGEEDLILTGSPKVKISSSSEFVVSIQPNSMITKNGSTTFSIAFDPVSIGTKTATVSIESNDGETSPYTFSILGGTEVAGDVSFGAETYRFDQGATQAEVTLERRNGTKPLTVEIDTSDGVQSAVPPFVAALAGDDYWRLAERDQVVSFEEGEVSKTVRVNLRPESMVTGFNKRFFISIVAVSNDGILGDHASAKIEVLAEDKVRPTLALAAPAAKINAVQDMIPVQGIAGDAKGLDRVDVALNGAVPVPAELGSATHVAAVPYSFHITPQSGVNTLLVTAYDLKGNSTSVTRRFTFTRRYVLTLKRVAESVWSPSVVSAMAIAATPSAGATLLTPKGDGSNPRTSDVVPGTKVKLTAQPKSEHVFARWSGLPAGAVTAGNVATFTMPEEDVPNVTATFEPNQFWPAFHGQSRLFQGLIRAGEGTAVSNSTEGLITGALTDSGIFTGKILVDGVSQSFVCYFYGRDPGFFKSGGTLVPFLDFGGRKLVLSFQIEGDDGRRIAAQLTKGGDSSEGILRRVGYSNKEPYQVNSSLLNSAAKGFYTMRFSGRIPASTAEAATYPQGDGYAAMTLMKNGNLSLAGVLADGTTITASSNLFARECPVFIPLVTPGVAASIKGGSFVGMLRFDPAAAGSDVTGVNLLWFRAEAVGTKAVAHLYTAGWPNGIHVNASGALYDVKRKVQQTLGLGSEVPVAANATLVLSGGKLAESIAKTNLKISGNAVSLIPASDAGFTLKLAPSTGGFSGTFTPNWAAPASAKPTFKGILIQKGDSKCGYGFFLSNAVGDEDPEGGKVLLNKQQASAESPP